MKVQRCRGVQDTWLSYTGVAAKGYVHRLIDHGQGQYARPRGTHINGIETGVTISPGPTPGTIDGANPVPETSSMLLFATSLVAAAIGTRRRSRKESYLKEQ